MKEYEIMPRNWNEKHNDLEWVGDSVYTSNYVDAVRRAKKLSMKYDRCDIEYFEIKKSDLGFGETVEDEWMYNRGSYHQWTESYEKGKQVPCVYFNNKPLWRWDGLDRDLKPRKEGKQ